MVIMFVCLPMAKLVQVRERVAHDFNCLLDDCVTLWPGKTYTMEGPDDMSEETCGVIPRAMNQVFLNSNEREKFGWKVSL